jgi:hypothetical protein
MSVHIKKLSEFYHRFSPKFWPGIPPIFPNCGESGPSPEDIEEARELFKLLDPESKSWYRRHSRIFDGL